MKNNGYLYSNLTNIEDRKSDLLKEYPRKKLERYSYESLNGERDFTIKKDSDLPTNYDKKILVPYACETSISGISHLVTPDEYMFYHKEIDLFKFKNNDHIIINFDGVDQICELFINRKSVFKHEGGYTKFSFDLKPYLNTDNKVDLVIKVQDFTDTSYYSRGKQTLNPNNWFYTSTSGIYKPVWLEGYNEKYIKEIRYRSDFDNKEIKIFVEANGEGEAKLLIDNIEYKIEVNKEININLENNFHPWETNNPYLYKIEVNYFDDKVKSYFGLRKIEIKQIDGKSLLFLNNKPLFISGLLDQGYYYLGGLTPLSYKDYYNDLKNIKELGYNCLRKHIKIECDMFYYYADLLGVLIIQDFPNGGTKYKLLNNIKPGISYKIFNKAKYLSYKGYGRKDEINREHFKQEADQIYNELRYYPSIIIFTIFNEGWGEFDPSYFYKKFKKIDMNSHLFDTASGWLDTVDSDFLSIHAYYFTHKTRKDSLANRPYFLSETGGIGYKIKDHFNYPKFYGHRNVKNSKDFNKKIDKLYNKDLIPLMEKGELIGVIYTQLNDCEKEGNGIYTFDRSILKLDENLIKEINRKIDNLNRN